MTLADAFLKFVELAADGAEWRQALARLVRAHDEGKITANEVVEGLRKLSMGERMPPPRPALPSAVLERHRIKRRR